MIQIGRTYTLTVLKKLDFGYYLDGLNLGEILLPINEAIDSIEIGAEVSVFIYLDSDDRLIATTLLPKVQVGHCACLKVVDKNATGVFLDWGLKKDLFVPFAEQRVPMSIGRSYVVYVYLDNSMRIAASSRLSRFLSEFAREEFIVNQAVDLLICTRSEMGYKAVVDGSHLGLLHQSELINEIQIGQSIRGFIKFIREDDLIDLTLQVQGSTGRDILDQKILDYLIANDGVLGVTDKSSPEEIFQLFSVSKANYKKSLGRLYKAQAIILTKTEITLKL